MIAKDGLVGLLARFRGTLVAVGLFTVCINLLMLTFPIYMINVYSKIFSSRSMETLVLLTLITVSTLVVQWILNLIRSQVLSRIGILLDTGLSGTILTTIIRETASGFRPNTQSLRDMTELRSFVTGPGVLSLLDAPFAPIYLVVLYLLHPMFAVFGFFSCLLLLSVGYCNELFTRLSLKEAREAAAFAINQADGFSRNADVIDAMGMMPAVIGRWRSSNTHALSLLRRASDRADIFSTFARFLRILIQTLIYGFGAYLFINNEMMGGSMFVAAILMSRALAPVESSIRTWKDCVSARAAYGRLKQTLSQANTFFNSLSLPPPEGRLQVERILATAPGSERVTLKGISLDLKPGEFLGVIGPSGAGKTSLAKVLVGIIRPRAGVVRLDGAKIHDWNPDELGPHIGYLPQDVQLFAGTVADNIGRMGLEVSSEAVVAAAKMAGAHDMILRLPKGYDTELGDGGLGLSAGQRQHIGLARALFGNPRLIVLDEPNANLDSYGELALVQSLAVAKAKGSTLVVITHRPSILKAADKILVLRDGTVDQYGSRDEIMAMMMKPSNVAAPNERLLEKKKIAAVAQPKQMAIAGRRAVALTEQKSAVAQLKPAAVAEVAQETIASPGDQQPVAPTSIERLFSGSTSP